MFAHFEQDRDDELMEELDELEACEMESQMESFDVGCHEVGLVAAPALQPAAATSQEE